MFKFPKDFVWGVSTASHQIEGGWNEDGKSPSIWDTFSHTPGKIKGGSTGNVACDHYHRYKEDIEIIGDLGAKGYRFSISWSRVIPDGKGKINPKGIDFYNKVVDLLLDNNIEPFITLYHWDLPQMLEDKGGWLSRETAGIFAEYAEKMVRALGDRVKYWMTFNEMNCFISSGYGTGTNAPGKKVPPKLLNQAFHHVFLAHGMAIQAMRGVASDFKIGIAQDLADMPVPIIENKENIKAVKNCVYENYGAILDPLIKGRYPSYMEKKGGLPEMETNDLSIINQKLNFLGINIYSGIYVEAKEEPPGYRVIDYGKNYPTMGWVDYKIVPHSIYWALKYCTEEYRPETIIITENGYSTDDSIGFKHSVEDIDRIMVLRSNLIMVHQAIEEGMPVKGYFLWSLMDNFEWAEGYTKRLGIYYVDYKSQKRLPKLSARWYKEVIAKGEIL